MHASVLRSVRRRIGLTVNEMGQVLHVISRVYDRFESGERAIPAGVESEVMFLHSFWLSRVARGRQAILTGAVKSERQELPSSNETLKFEPTPDLLLHLREEMGLRQAELAIILGIGLRTWQRYEKGQFPADELVYENFQDLHAHWDQVAETARNEIIQRSDEVLAGVRANNEKLGGTMRRTRGAEEAA